MNKDPIKFIEKLLETLNKEYKEKLEIIYPVAYLENPEAFPLANIRKIDTYIIKGDEKLLGNSYYVFLYQGTGVIKNLGGIDREEYSRLKDFNSSNEFISDIINNVVPNEKETYYIQLFHLDAYLNDSYRHMYNTTEDYIEKQINNISSYTLNQLNNDGNKFINHIDKEASYYAKNAFRYAYSELDFSPIIKAVNDEDFEYALSENIACYDKSLYLAAVSTAGTALENLIIRILETKNELTDDNGITELGELSGRLRRLGLIDRRERHRIMSAASFRNMASHANKGRVIRQDAKVVYQAIFNLSSKFFDIPSY